MVDIDYIYWFIRTGVRLCSHNSLTAYANQMAANFREWREVMR